MSNTKGKGEREAPAQEDAAKRAHQRESSSSLSEALSWLPSQKHNTNIRKNIITFHSKRRKKNLLSSPQFQLNPLQEFLTSILKNYFIKIGFMTSLIGTFLWQKSWDDYYWTKFLLSISLEKIEYGGGRTFSFLPFSLSFRCTFLAHICRLKDNCIQKSNSHLFWISWPSTMDTADFSYQSMRRYTETENSI